MASSPSPTTNEPLDLSPKMRELYNCLVGEGDVPILDLYAKLINPIDTPLRVAQQHIGSYVARLNQRLRKHSQVVKPGRIKGTYVLTSL